LTDIEIGHANFLDELIEEFRIDDDAEDPRREQAALKKQKEREEQLARLADKAAEELAAAASAEPIGKEQAMTSPKSFIEYDEEDTVSDEWSECDSSDDDDHALVRTQSGRLQSVEIEVDDSSEDEEIYGIMPQLSRDVGSSSENSPASDIDGPTDYFNLGSALPKDASMKQVENAEVEILSPMSTRG
jgi:hypothetical protein